jgi:S-adenosylmethionine hydrolase
MFKGLKVILGAAIVALLAMPACAQQPAPLKVVGFMTDFDVKDDAVGICKAVMDGVAPGVRIIDVGSTRKAIIARSRVGQIFVLPDNGLLTLVQDRDGIVEAHEITNPAWMIGTGISSTFHGRDIFSPAGAHAARGEDIALAGPALDLTRLVRLDLHNATIDSEGLHGEVIGTDGPFGNLVLNVPAETFRQLGYKLGDQVPVTLDGKQYAFPFVKTFSDVPVGKELFYIDSRGRLSIGINQRNFAETYKVGEGSALMIPKKGVK